MKSTNTPSATPPTAVVTNATLAAVCSSNTTAVDLKIEALVTRLLGNGYHIQGVLQKPVDKNATGCNARLYRIGVNGQYNISQQLGAGSSSCNLDTEVLEQAAFDISSAITPDTDLVVVNRFGKRESQGGGFRAVFERAMELDIPVLTVVQEQMASSWLDYGGSSVALLRDDTSDLREWIEIRLSHPKAQLTPTSAVA